MSDWKYFSSSESPCLPNASHQVSAQSDTVREQMSFEDFQDAHHGGHLGYWNGTNLAILNLHVAPMPPTRVRLNPTYRFGADVVWRFQEGHRSGHLGYWNAIILAIWISMLLQCLPWSFSSIRLMVLEEMSFNDFQDGRYGDYFLYRNGMIFTNAKPPCGPDAIHQVWA